VEHEEKGKVLDYQSAHAPRRYGKIFFWLALAFGVAHAIVLTLAMWMVFTWLSIGAPPPAPPPAFVRFVYIAGFPLIDLFSGNQWNGWLPLILLGLGNAVLWGITLSTICVAILKLRHRLVRRIRRN
jgi:hypothetical protein